MCKPKPITPGELLREEFLEPMGITQYRLAKEIGVPPQRIGEIVAGRRAVTADTDLRLCRFFGLSKGYWLRAQAAHDQDRTAAIKRRKLRRELATAYRDGAEEDLALAAEWFPLEEEAWQKKS